MLTPSTMVKPHVGLLVPFLGVGEVGGHSLPSPEEPVTTKRKAAVGLLVPFLGVGEVGIEALRTRLLGFVLQGRPPPPPFLGRLVALVGLGASRRE